MKFKFRLLKAIDVAGLQILDPVIRLFYREDPPTQLRRIGMFIVIPTLTFIAFLLAWNWAGPRHTTKAGEVPTPVVVWEAAKGIVTFHEREETKAVDFKLSGEARSLSLVEVESRIAQLEPLAADAAARLADAERASRERLAEAIKPFDDAYRAKRREYAADAKAREAGLLALAATATPAELQAAVSDHQLKSNIEAEEIKILRDERKATEDRRDPALQAARAENNRFAEELQFLRKRHDLLTSENGALKEEGVAAQLAEAEAALAAATEPAERLKLASTLVGLRESLAQAGSASYSQPWTLPGQIKRSLACVFTGFVVASLIAIPLGILCGMSKAFMASLTPLISLFKPVSPIVWLPIIAIIVGGFIPDPTSSPILSTFNAIPGFSGLQINPAFLSSALTVALCSLWPTLVNTALGVAAVDRDHMNVARVLRLGFWSRLFKIIVPSALPLIFAGLRISLGVGWMVLIAAELLSSSEGIGKFVWDMFNNGSSQTFAQMFVVVFVVGIIGLLLDRIMIVFQRLVSFDGAPTSL
ncbi:MAG TPA: ABC transporter permease [Opitutaceae bacterium]